MKIRRDAETTSENEPKMWEQPPSAVQERSSAFWNTLPQLFQSRLCEHLLELAAGPHVNGLRHQLAFSIIDKALG